MAQTPRAEASIEVIGDTFAFNSPVTGRFRAELGEAALSHAIRYCRYFGYDSLSSASKRAYATDHPANHRGMLIPYGLRNFAKMMSDPATAGYLNQTTDLPILQSLGYTAPNRWGPPVPGQDSLSHTWYAQSVAVESIGACGVCVAEQVRTVGYSWWQRNHVLPGVCVCSVHGLVLQRFEIQEVLKEQGKLPHDVVTDARQDATSFSYAKVYTHAVQAVASSAPKLSPSAVLEKTFDHLPERLGGDLLSDLQLSELLQYSLPAAEATAMLASAPSVVRRHALLNGTRRTSWVPMLLLAVLAFGSFQQVVRAGTYD